MMNPRHLVHSHAQEPESSPGGILRRGRWAFWILALLAALLLVSEHRVHILGALPYLILLACPLLHMFMHGGHGGHGGHGEPVDREPPSGASRDPKE